MSSGLSPNAQAVRSAAGGRYYGRMYLAFATLAYLDESANNIIHVGTDLGTAIGKLTSPPVPSGDTGWGAWSVDWGPALFDTDENLMYIASFRESPAASPVMTVLAIRGTDISAGTEAVLGEIFEDVRDWTHVRWSRASSNDRLPCLPDLDPFDQSTPKIASGTCQGVERLRSMTQVPAGGSAAMRADEYLQSLLAQDPGLPIVVTGHSLGACQTTVMSMYLADVLPQGTRILPNPFAPPTAGNAAFASLYDRTFPEGNVWWNTLDLVPNAYAKGSAETPGNLSYAEGLWQASGGPGNPAFKDTIELLQSTLPEYVQPTAGEMRLTGQLADPALIAAWYATMPQKPSSAPNTWSSQLMWQHFPPNYYLLMSAQIAGLAEYPFAGTLPA